MKNEGTRRKNVLPLNILIAIFIVTSSLETYAAITDTWWYAIYSRAAGAASSPEEALSRSCTRIHGIFTGETCDIEYLESGSATGGCVTFDGRCSKRPSEFTPPKEVSIRKMKCTSGYFKNDIRACITPQSSEPNRGVPMCPSPLQGNPVHAATGNKIQEEMDYTSHAPFPLTLKRTYNSADINGQHLVFGNGWRDRYSSKIVFSSTSSLYIYHEDGSMHYWYLSNGEYSSATEPKSSLKAISDGWIYTSPSNISKKYNSNGYLTEVTNANGLSHSVTYNMQDKVDMVTSGFGHSLSFNYDYLLRVTSVVTPDGQTYGYEYDDKGNLVTVIYPDSTSDQSDNPRKQYHYEDVNFPSALTGITNENGVRHATWTYDQSGRVTDVSHASNTDSFNFTYNSDGTTTIIDPFSNQRTLTYTSPSGVIRVTSSDGESCANCGLQDAYYLYDTNGLLVEKADKEGNISKYSYNSDGMPEDHTQGFGTPFARTISTEWHPDFRKPVRITEPDRITEFTYDSAGRLLSKTERALP